MAKQRPVEIKQGVAEYMATYGDLVTLLLCFFVLLYASATIDQSKFDAIAASVPGSTVSKIDFGGASEGIMEMLGSGIMEMSEPSKEVQEEKEESDRVYEEAQAELNQMASDFKTYLAESNLQESIKVELTDRFIKINLPNDILFASGSANIRPEAIPVLDMVAGAIATYSDCDVIIEGHADDRPINTIQFKNNWYLSCARASEVALHFVETQEIDPSRLIPEGYGEYRPIATNATEEGRAKNRRVEIKILSKYYSGDVS